MINSDYMNALYKVISKIVKLKVKEMVGVPEMPAADAEGVEPSEEDKQAAQKLIEEALKTNQEVEKYNQDVQAIQAKVKIAVR